MCGLREILCGPLAQKLGNNLSMVESPGENTPVLHFIRAVLPLIKDKPIYRRDNVVVLPDHEGQRLSICRPPIFRTWLDRYVAPFRFARQSPKPANSTIRSLYIFEILRVIFKNDFTGAWAVEGRI